MDSEKEYICDLIIAVSVEESLNAQFKEFNKNIFIAIYRLNLSPNLYGQKVSLIGKFYSQPINGVQFYFYIFRF